MDWERRANDLVDTVEAKGVLASVELQNMLMKSAILSLGASRSGSLWSCINLFHVLCRLTHVLPNSMALSVVTVP